MGQYIADVIPEKFKRAETWELIIKRIIYILCFTAICLLDQVIGSATGRIQYALKNYTGVIIAILTLSAYKLKDFIKLPYFIWAVVFFIGRYFALEWGEANAVNFGEFECIVWNVGIYGVVLIRMFYCFIIERKRVRVNWPFFGIWLIMMLGMLLSQSDNVWPGFFLLFFVCFYIADFTEEDLNNLYSGMAEGIIIGFLIIQGQALLHRPYDVLRYLGMYSNANMNALFYAFSYAAVLCKWYQMKLKRRHVLLRLPMILLAGSMYGLTILTMGRTALITMVLITIIFLLFQALSLKKYRMREVLIDAGLLLLTVVVCFVPTYSMVRYIPAYVDEPVYFESDNEDSKVHKGDSVDSEKYIDLETVIEASFGRILWFLDNKEDEDKSIVGRTLFPTLKVYASALEENENTWIEYDEVYVKPGTDERHPILTQEEYLREPVKLRASIYKYYFQNLNLRGHLSEEHGVWITEDYNAPHAHNILLQIAFDYGWPVGILFIVIIISLYNKVIYGVMDRRQGAWYYRLFLTGAFATVLVCFGMLEIDWIYGQAPLTMFFVILYIACHKSRRKYRAKGNRMDEKSINYRHQ